MERGRQCFVCTAGTLAAPHCLPAAEEQYGTVLRDSVSRRLRQLLLRAQPPALSRIAVTRLALSARYPLRNKAMYGSSQQDSMRLEPSAVDGLTG